MILRLRTRRWWRVRACVCGRGGVGGGRGDGGGLEVGLLVMVDSL